MGDVWFCSGQSNMVLPMERVKEKYPEAIAGANFPEIRNFFVPTASDITRVHDDLPRSQWMEASPKNVLGFGAATWFFASRLYQKYHVPIGIINSSVGGTPIQAWISADGLQDVSSYAERVARFRDTAYTGRLLHPATTGPSTTGPAGTGAPREHVVRPGDQGLTDSLKWYDVNYVPEG